MPRTRFVPLLGALLIGGCGLVGQAGAQPPDRRESLSDVVLPCGVRAALAAIGDRSAPDRGHFILEIARRVHQTPVGADADRKDALPPLIAHLDRCGDLPSAAAAETLPLPLPVSMWVDTVFGGRVNAKRLAAAILESRNASLLYIGLLSLDEATRNWIAGRPDLVTDLVTRHAAAFTLIAPGLRATSAGIQAPGGERAGPVWEALVGRSTKDPAEFIRALLAADDRYLPYMFGALTQLSDAEARLALNLDADDPDARIASARRLHAIYIRVAQGWRVESRAFSRPLYDPALLAADLRHDDEGRPVLPGTREFWEAAFDDGDQLPDDPRTLLESEPVEFSWLCERVFEGPAPRHRDRYHQVLFGSRMLARTLNADQVLAAAEAVRAAERYPALVTALERAEVVDVKVIAAAARRAGRLSKIGNVNDAVRASAQFQGVLTLLQRATLRNSISSHTFADLVKTLAAVDLTNDNGGEAYRGGLVRWLDRQLEQLKARAATSATDSVTAATVAAGTVAAPDDGARNFGDFHAQLVDAQPMERTLLDLAAGRPTAASTASLTGAPQPRLVGDGDPAPAGARFVEWEGTRYRIDLTSAEAARMERLRGEQSRPYVSAARALIGMADALRDPGLTRDALSREARVFARVEQAVGWTDGRAWSDDQHWLGADTRDRAREVAAALQRIEPQAGLRADPRVGQPAAQPAAREGRREGKRVDRAAAARLAPSLLLLADALLARGLTELVYASALGRPERAGFSAEEAAAHHDFGTRINGMRNSLGPWEHPVLSGLHGDSRVTGSLLGLDVTMAPFSLLRLSSKLPPKRPTLNENDRRALIESVVLVRELDDADRDRIVEAIGKGRERLAAVTASDQAVAIADEIGMTGARRSLLIWSVTRTPDRVATFLSPSELLWLGLGPARIDARLHAWGAPARPRLGCLCLQIIDRRPLDPFTGRWGSAIFITAFPDLNLRLAELLAELRMPAALLGPVLASATLEVVNNTASRDADDRRALVDFVAALTRDRLEQYLALLTTDGPLVPVGKAPERTISTGMTGVP